MIKCEKKIFRNTKYLIYYPIDFDKNKKYPLFFHLHGAGNRGQNFAEFKGSTILKLLDEGKSPLSNAICVFPQCHNDTWFVEFEELQDFLKEMINLPFVDSTRVTGSGVSMGGYAIYQVMMNSPHLFNKAFVCCGGGMYWNAFVMKNIKFRIFHGLKDMAVFPEESRHMFDRLKEADADVSLFVYPECDHNCWEKAYNDLDNLKWIVE